MADEERRRYNSATSLATNWSFPGNTARSFPIKTADLMYVAMMEFGFDEFVTADKQQ